jgi:hypothetical protein
MRGRERHWWGGFAFFGGGYLALTLAPVFSQEVMPRHVTTKALRFVHSEFVASTSIAPLPEVLWWRHARLLEQVDRLKGANPGPGDRELDSAMRMLANVETQLKGAADQRDFIHFGHCRFALLAGLMGGTVAVWFFARRERERADLSVS